MRVGIFSKMDNAKRACASGMSVGGLSALFILNITPRSISSLSRIGARALCLTVLILPLLASTTQAISGEIIVTTDMDSCSVGDIVHISVYVNPMTKCLCLEHDWKVTIARIGGGFVQTWYWNASGFARFWKMNLTWVAQLVGIYNITAVLFQHHASASKIIEVTEAPHEPWQDLYNALWNRYLILEANYSTLKYQYEQLQGNYSSLSSGFDSLKNQYNVLKADYGSSQTTIDSLKSELGIVDSQLAAAAGELADLKAALGIAAIGIVVLLVILVLLGFLFLRRERALPPPPPVASSQPAS